MKSKIDSMTIGGLIKLREDKLLIPNWEYQRGAVWTEKQMRLLIDSILRDYQTPLIYLREITKGDDRYGSTSLEVIDGQQRINSLWGFTSGYIINNEYPDGKKPKPFKALINPQSEEDSDDLPVSLRKYPCYWAGKTFKEFSEEKQKEFLEREVPVVIIKCDDDETRDLFIRLQGGSSLKAQEIRDSWPGDFCHLVVRIGGKPQHKEPGHEFFRTVMNAKPAKDRGRTRQLVAQLLTLFLSRRENKDAMLHSIKSDILDSQYRQRAGLYKNQSQVDEVDRFEKILDKLTSLFKDGERNPLKAHDVLHLVLLVDTLWDDYTSKWTKGITKAYDNFAAQIGQAREIKKLADIGSQDKELRDVWEYYQKTKASSDNKETIERRHEIYVRRMFRLLGNNLVIKDPQRGFPFVMRQIIYYRDDKKCVKCGDIVKWRDAEIHHKVAHSDGGKTILDNGVLMCQVCHQELHRNS